MNPLTCAADILLCAKRRRGALLQRWHVTATIRSGPPQPCCPPSLCCRARLGAAATLKHHPLLQASHIPPTPCPPRFQARVTQAAQLGVDVPVLLKVFAPAAAAAASPLMQAEAAPVNLMTQCVHVSLESLPILGVKCAGSAGTLRPQASFPLLVTCLSSFPSTCETPRCFLQRSSRNEIM